MCVFVCLLVGVCFVTPGAAGDTPQGDDTPKDVLNVFILAHRYVSPSFFFVCFVLVDLIYSPCCSPL